MAYLAAATDWLNSWGPIGWGLAGLFSFFAVLLGLAAMNLVRAVAAERRANADAVRDWSSRTDNVNPLSTEFHRVRARFLDLMSPIDHSIRGKKFYDCELIGFADLLAIGSTFNRVGFADCQIIVVKTDAKIINAVALIDCEIHGGTISRTNLFVPRKIAEHLASIGVPVITNY